MFFIPGWLISILTFPGVIAHEIAHKLFCDLAGIKVFKTCYFRVGNPAGYVLHEMPKSLASAFLISIGPLIINSLLCIILTLGPSLLFFFLHGSPSESFVLLFLGWVGYSIGMHAFPSNDDMANFLHQVEVTHHKGLLYWGSFLFAWIIKIANLLRVFWFDFFYAVGLSMILPLIIISYLK